MQAYRDGTAFPTCWFWHPLQQTRAIRRYTDATWRIVPGVGRATLGSLKSPFGFCYKRLQGMMLRWLRYLDMLSIFNTWCMYSQIWSDMYTYDSMCSCSLVFLQQFVIRNCHRNFSRPAVAPSGFICDLFCHADRGLCQACAYPGHPGAERKQTEASA